MHIEQIRELCLSLENVTEGFPFGEDTLVFKVNNKLFLLAGLDAFPLQINVKCNPDTAVELRDAYPNHVLPGYHMNKKHWNTIIIDGYLPDDFIVAQINHSYDLVARKKK